MLEKSKQEPKTICFNVGIWKYVGYKTDFFLRLYMKYDAPTYILNMALNQTPRTK